MLITDFSGQTMPVQLTPAMVERLPACGVRAVALPLPRYDELAAGDALWVREPLFVPARQRRDDCLTVRYYGDRRWTDIPWPGDAIKPRAEFLLAGDMPRPASRFTLLVEAASLFPLRDVAEEDALCAGVITDGDGFGAVGYPFMAPFLTPWEALRFLFGQMNDSGEQNPDIALIRFRAISRNISFLLNERFEDAAHD